MAKYNSGVKYNINPNYGGFTYNSAIYVIRFNIVESFKFSETENNVLLKLLITDSCKMDDQIFSHLMAYFDDKFSSSDLFNFKRFFDFVETINLKDQFQDIILKTFITEDIKTLENISTLSREISFLDDIKIKEIMNADRLVSFLDELKLNGLAELLNLRVNITEQMILADKEPRKTISDLYIGMSEDGTYNVLEPFGMMIDWSNSVLNSVPEIRNEIVTLPNIDGGLIKSTVYGTRRFSITAYSELGLSESQKQIFVGKMANTIDNIKNRQAKMSIGDAGISFDVYPDEFQEVETKQGNYVKASFNLISPNPYGYRLFESEHMGSGLLINEGVIDVGARIEAVGYIPQGNLSFMWGSDYFIYNKTLNETEKLIIDTTNNKFTVTHIMNENQSINGKPFLIGDISKIKIPFTMGVTLVINDSISDKFTTYWKEPFLWNTTTESF